MSTKSMTLYSLYVLEVYSDNAVTFLMHVCIHIIQYTLYILTYIPGKYTFCYILGYFAIHVSTIMSHWYLYSLHPFIYNFFLYAYIDAGEHPTGPPREHQATHPPLRARRSESLAPATLTCWSDPDPVAEEGGVQGAVGSAFNINGSISK